MIRYHSIVKKLEEYRDNPYNDNLFNDIKNDILNLDNAIQTNFETLGWAYSYFYYLFKNGADKEEINPAEMLTKYFMDFNINNSD